MDGIGSGSCPVVGFGVVGIVIVGFATRRLVYWWISACSENNQLLFS